MAVEEKHPVKGAAERNGKECDDGNSDPDDGGDQCKFGCIKDAECNDKEPCNGAETCSSSHKCLDGTPLSDGKACTSGSVSGTCKAGKCVAPKCGNGVKDSGEECDDGNTKDGDGCDKDCKFSCHADKDCDDGTVCTGKETCKIEATKQTCVKGTPLKCDDGKACTTDKCDPVKGCINTPIDADKDGPALAPCGDDCNDGDATVYKGAPECLDGKDNDCNGTKDDNPVTAQCWPDPDEDGYAVNGSTPVAGCVCPAKYTSRNPATSAATRDCLENNKDVHPGTTSWYKVRYCNSWTGNPPVCNGRTYDYNCTGANEKRYAALSACVPHPADATHTAPYCTGHGWKAGQTFTGRVLSGEHLDETDHHLAPAVCGRDTDPEHGSFAHLCQISDGDRRAVRPHLEDDLLDVRQGSHEPLAADDILFAVAFDVAAAGVAAPSLDRLEQVLERQLVGEQLGRVHHDLVLLGQAAPRVHLRHPRDGAEARSDLPVEDRPTFHGRHALALDGELEHVPEPSGHRAHLRIAKDPLPAEPVVTKYFPNSFRGTNLLDLLKKEQVGHLVICGAMPQMCIDATTRAAFDFGFKSPSSRMPAQRRT